MNLGFEIKDYVLTEREWSVRGVRHGFSSQKERLPAGTIYPRQVHGLNDVAVRDGEFNSQNFSSIAADIIWTTKPDCVVAVQTADCIPLLFSGEGMVMAVHAGWRGLSRRILSRACDIFSAQNVCRTSIEVRVGPFISASEFEVGPEVLVHFAEAWKSDLDFCISDFSRKGHDDRSYLDMQALVSWELARCGIEPIQVKFSQICTKIDQNWQSYRRDGTLAGRNWAWIFLGEV